MRSYVDADRKARQQEALAAARETFDRIRQLNWAERQTNVAQRLAIQAIARIDAAIAKGEQSMGDSRNQGHGHVVPRPDGVKARCGGPAMCRVCQAERAALESAPQASQPPQGAEPDYSELSREALERHAKRLWQAMETAHDFWHRHAIGPLAAPSCLCCGKLPDEVAIRHMELPGVVICKTCRDAALAASPPPATQEPAEPLGEVVGTHKVGFAELATVAWAKGMPPVGTKLYAAPAPVSPV